MCGRGLIVQGNSLELASSIVAFAPSPFHHWVRMASGVPRLPSSFGLFQGVQMGCNCQRLAQGRVAGTCSWKPLVWEHLSHLLNGLCLSSEKNMDILITSTTLILVLSSTLFVSFLQMLVTIQSSYFSQSILKQRMGHITSTRESKLLKQAYRQGLCNLVTLATFLTTPTTHFPLWRRHTTDPEASLGCRWI